MNNNDKQITAAQWNSILETFNTYCKEKNIKEDESYIGDKLTTNPSGDRSKRRQYIYDNYDRYTSPGLEFILVNDMERGTLFVYNGSEQAHAPITFQQGLEIADNFFSYRGTELSEQIVCDYQMR